MKTITSSHPLSQTHRPDIQILRGVSVLVVFFYHLGLPVHGGFLGVDIFFVISGFVITGGIMGKESGVEKFDGYTEAWLRTSFQPIATTPEFRHSSRY